MVRDAKKRDMVVFKDGQGRLLHVPLKSDIQVVPADILTPSRQNSTREDGMRTPDPGDDGSYDNANDISLDGSRYRRIKAQEAAKHGKEAKDPKQIKEGRSTSPELFFGFDEPETGSATPTPSDTQSKASESTAKGGEDSRRSHHVGVECGNLSHLTHLLPSTTAFLSSVGQIQSRSFDVGGSWLD